MKFLAPQADLQVLMHRTREIINVLKINENQIANEVQRPVNIRTNTLKTRHRDLGQILINRGDNVNPLDKWTEVNRVIYNSQVPIGATSEYLGGHYMASSLLTVMALAALQPNERLLDMYAAPGALMRNSGLLVADDVNKDRAEAIISNTHRLGLTNRIMINLDGRHFSEVDDFTEF